MNPSHEKNVLTNPKNYTCSMYGIAKEKGKLLKYFRTSISMKTCKNHPSNKQTPTNSVKTCVHDTCKQGGLCASGEVMVNVKAINYSNGNGQHWTPHAHYKKLKTGWGAICLQVVKKLFLTLFNFTLLVLVMCRMYPTIIPIIYAWQRIQGA